MKRKRKRRERDFAERFLRLLLEELQSLIPGDRVPGMCNSCAFLSSENHRQGWDSTALGLLKVLESKNSKFGCHSNQPGWETDDFDLSIFRPCAGWTYLMKNHENEARSAVLRAALRLKKTPDRNPLDQTAANPVKTSENRDNA